MADSGVAMTERAPALSDAHKDRASVQGSFSRRRSFVYKDGRASVEQHLGILLEDLSTLGAQLTFSASEELVVHEAFMGLHYVWRMRIHDNLKDLDPDVCERLRQALLLFSNRVVYAGPRFLTRPIPSRFSVFAFVVFCGFVRDVVQFREAVNNNMSVADLRRALNVAQWLATTEVEEDPVQEGAPDEGMRWTAVTFSVEELKKMAVMTTLFLVQILNTCSDWKELVDAKGHAAFERYTQDHKTEMKSGAKALLAPKGQYWDTDVEKVVAMFRTNLDKGLSELEVKARKDVYGDNRTPEVHKTSAIMILFRQLADLIVVILILGECRVGVCC
jgi:hypothetical protein